MLLTTTFVHVFVIVANKAVKVKVADEVIDPNDTAAQKAVKAKAVRGDYRKSRQIRREVR